MYCTVRMVGSVLPTIPCSTYTDDCREPHGGKGYDGEGGGESDKQGEQVRFRFGPLI